MNLHCFKGAPPEWMSLALERFESQFQYPLGEDRHFSISHGRSYLPFFAAMGPATLLVAERQGEVLGTLVRVERWLHLHGNCPLKQLAHYMCDLKISSQARSSRVLALLMNEARRQIEHTGSRACYGIVMNGTASLPVNYTGRLGIPLFEKLAEIVVLRVAPSVQPPVPIAKTGPEAFPFPHAHDCVVTGGRSELRSQMQPVHLLDSLGKISGVVEDTRRAKCLWSDNGEELISAHLSGLHFDTARQGAEIVHQAVREVFQKQMPAVFLAIPKSKAQNLLPLLRDLNVHEAPATIYGHGLKAGYDWWVDTAEI